MANPTRQRDLARTRQALLDAARHEVKQRGVGVSLDAIARRSGVSKGGLLHHFHSKDELLLALAEDVYSEFEADVQRRAEAEPEGPGRWSRAFIRASFHEMYTPGLLLEHGVLLNLISTAPVVSEFVGDKIAHWRSALAADGMSPEVVRLVMLASDGAAVSTLSATQAPNNDALRSLEAQLIALIEHHEEVARLIRVTPATSEETP